jgi:hypothetical protein
MQTYAELQRYTERADQVLLAHSAFEMPQGCANNQKRENHV